MGKLAERLTLAARAVRSVPRRVVGEYTRAGCRTCTCARARVPLIVLTSSRCRPTEGTGASSLVDPDERRQRGGGGSALCLPTSRPRSRAGRPRPPGDIVQGEFRQRSPRVRARSWERDAAAAAPAPRRERAQQRGQRCPGGVVPGDARE